MCSKEGIAITVLAVGATLIAGCANQQESMVKQGYPPHYAEGFDDGCHSGNKAGGSFFDQFKKDVKRFETDSQYAQGWSDGFRQCESQQEAMARQTRMAIEQQKLIQARKSSDQQAKYQLEHEALKGVDTSGLKSLK